MHSNSRWSSMAITGNNCSSFCQLLYSIYSGFKIRTLNGLQLHSLTLHMVQVHMVSSCDESQTGVSLCSPPDQTSILWQQWPPVTQNVLHSQVVPNELKASVRGDTRINTSLVPIQAFLGSCKQSQTGAKFVTVITKKCQKYLNIHSPADPAFILQILYCFCWPCKMWTKSFASGMWQISLQAE